MAEAFDPYYVWLGIRPADQPADYYRLLGIERFEENPDVISNASDQRMAHVRSFRNGSHIAASERILNEIAKARGDLLNPARKAAYDSLLHERQAARVATPSPSQKSKPAQLPRAITLAPTDFGSPAQPGPQVQTSVRRRQRNLQFPILIAIATAVVIFVGAVLVWSLRDQGEALAVKDESAQATGGEDPASKTDSATETQSKTSAVVQATNPVVISGGPESLDNATESPAPAVEPVASDSEPAPDSDEKPEPAPAVEVVAEPMSRTEADSEPKPVAGPADPAADETLVAATAQLPVPDKASRDEAGKLIDEIFGADLKQAKNNEEKSRVAERMLESAAQTDLVPASRFVLLDKTRQIGIEVGDAPLIKFAMERLAQNFDVDELQVLATSIQAATRERRDVEQYEALAQQLLELLDRALAEKRFDVVEIVTKSLEDATRRVRQVDLRKAIRDHLRDVQQLLELRQKGELAGATLEQAPDDPAANLVYGRYLALVMRNWNKAMPHLAKSGDDALQKVAAQDLANPTRNEEQIQTADGWYNYATGNKSNAGFLGRAQHWYLQALPNATGLAKEKIQVYLGKLEQQYEAPADSATASNDWKPLAEKDYLTQCYTLGPFPQAQITDLQVFNYLRKHKPREKLLGKSFVATEGKVIDRYGKTVPTFIGPEEIEQFMYYIFQVKTEKDQSVRIVADTFWQYGHNKLAIAVNFTPVSNDTDVPLRRGIHKIVVKQHFVRTDRPDRSYIRLQLVGANLLQKATLP